MLLTTTALLALGAAFFAYLVSTVLQWRRLAHVPGPFLASLTKGWMVKESLKGCQPISFKEVNDKYGKMPTAVVCMVITNRAQRLTGAGRP